MIRQATMNDVNDICHLMEELENTHFKMEPFKKRFERVLEDNAYDCVVYEQEGKVVGMLTILYKIPLHHENDTMEIVEFCVDQEYRSRGIGGELLQYTEKMATEKDLEQIELCSKITRHRAHDFYKNHAFEMIRYNFTKDL